MRDTTGWRKYYAFYVVPNREALEYIDEYVIDAPVVARAARYHKEWISVKYKGKRYQLLGGWRTPYWIDLSRPIAGR